MKQAESDAEYPAASMRSWVWTALKWLLFGLVVVFVGKRGHELWRQDEVSQIDVHFGWLVSAGCVYLVGWLPSIWFWRRLLLSVGGDVSFRDTARAYCCGHLGKYVPGKAMALIIRAALMKDRGVRPAAAALTAAYETLAMMSVGLAVAVALSPLILTESQWQSLPISVRQLRDAPVLISVAVVAVALGLMPLLSRLFTKVAVAMMPPDVPNGKPIRSVRIKTQLLLTGSLAFVVVWACRGLSLGLTVHAISADVLNLRDWPVWMGAVSLATAVGFFVVFAPGGIGVREGLLIEMLQNQPLMGQQQTVAAAVLLRVVWFAAEIVAAGVLYYLIVPSNGRSEQTEPAD